jgi:hypothetical protein
VYLERTKAESKSTGLNAEDHGNTTSVPSYIKPIYVEITASALIHSPTSASFIASIQSTHGASSQIGDVLSKSKED